MTNILGRAPSATLVPDSIIRHRSLWRNVYRRPTSCIGPPFSYPGRGLRMGKVAYKQAYQPPRQVEARTAGSPASLAGRILPEAAGRET